MAELPTDDDPQPVPPVRPSLEDCCKGSCDPCVFDLYERASERYRAAFDAWLQRKSGRKSEAGRPA
jgi:hypothetical protein